MKQCECWNLPGNNSEANSFQLERCKNKATERVSIKSRDGGSSHLCCAECLEVMKKSDRVTDHFTVA